MEKDPIQTLDDILKFFVTSPLVKGGITDGELLKALAAGPQIHMLADDLIPVLMKLEKDGYINSKIKTPYAQTARSYHIAFEGVIQYKLGGYKALVTEASQLKELQHLSHKREQTTLLLTKILATGTGIAAIYYIIEAIKIFFPCLFPKC